MPKLINGSGKHIFGQPKPSAKGANLLHVTAVRDTHFRDLPAPTGTGPFRLDIKDIVSLAVHRQIRKSKTLTFHLNDDMCGIRYAVLQE